ncbi:MAG: hypothetical protein QM793_12120 [Muricomes sp.]
MLGKLLKYDLKYGVRIFIILHAILLTACVLGRFLFMDKLDFQAEPDIIFSVIAPFFALFVVLFSTISLGTLALLAVRFYKNLFTDEGYLSWTLPATSTQQIWAKILSGAVWYILDILISVISLAILVTGNNVTTAYAKVAPEFTAALGMPLEHYSLIILLFTLASTVSSIIMIYMCIAVGQLFPGHRVLGSILAYFILSTVIQVVVLGLMFAFNMFPYIYTNNVTVEMNATEIMLSIFKLSGGISFISTILEYIAMHHILSKKLNLI